MKHRSVTLGIAAAILAAVVWTIMDVFVKSLPRIGAGEISLLRGIIGMLFLPWLARREGKPLISGKDTALLHLRGFTGGFGMVLFFVSVHGLTLGDAEILSQLCAFFMCLMAPFFLRTRPGRAVVLPLVTIAVGAAVTLRVWDFDSFNGYALIGLASAISSAGAYICIGKLTEVPGRHSGTELVLYFQIYSIICGALLMPFTGIVWPTAQEWVWIVLVAVTALAGQMLFAWGCLHVHSIIISFVMYTAILFHILAGWLFWGEVLTLCSWVGGALIVAGSALLLWRTK